MAAGMAQSEVLRNKYREASEILLAKYLLSTYYVLDTLLGTEETTVSKRNYFPHFHGPHILMGDRL